VKEASSDVLNSTATVTAVGELLTDIDKMMGNYTEHFPAIAEPETSKKNETSKKINNCSVWSDPVPKKNLAPHSTTDSLSETPPDTSSQHGSESPCSLLNSPDQCQEIVDKIDGYDGSEKHDLVQLYRKYLLKLSLSKHGSRVVQKLIEVAAGSDRDVIIEELAGHVCELYDSPHGNFVISRAIQVFPASKYTFILSALQGKGIVAVSKHKFGCRVVCRLLEHCNDDQINQFMGELLENIEPLAKHQYGNFVVQSIIEQGSSWQSSWRASVIFKLLQVFPSLCMDRSGSLVAQNVLETCDTQGIVGEDVVNSAIERLNAENLLQVACHRYGSYVIEQLASMQSSYPAARHSADILAKGICELQSSDFSQKVVAAFELLPNEP
jgi:hypothetical protein